MISLGKKEREGMFATDEKRRRSNCSSRSWMGTRIERVTNEPYECSLFGFADGAGGGGAGP